MELQRECSGSETLRLEGELTIQHAGQLKEKLLQAFAETEALALDLEGVTEVDIACLQLLCSAHKTFRMANKELKTISMIASPFQRAIDDSGYRRKIGCHSDPKRDCLWVMGGCHE